MAQATTLLRVAVELADVDRGVYESLDLRVAQHPSESRGRVVVRVLARCLVHEEGLEFGRGLSNVDEPALWSHGPHGGVAHWVDIGAPSADRLHRASKLAERVSVVTDKDTQPLQKEWSSRAVHRAEEVQILELPPELVDALAEELGLDDAWVVSLVDAHLSVTCGAGSYAGEIRRRPLSEFLLQDPA